MTKLTLEQQELLFANDCKLINLRYEYHGYTGSEKWAIVTELAEEELWVKYPDVIRRYTPFILLSMAQGEVIDESYRNNDKYEKRAKRTIDVYGYEDDISEQFHRELITPFVDPFEQAEEERIEEEKEQLRQLEIAKVNAMTGMRQHTGNWSGKTVGNALGETNYKDTKIILADIPGPTRNASCVQMNFTGSSMRAAIRTAGFI